MNVLEVKNLLFSYHTLQGETEVIDDLSFSVKKGEFISIVGPSGCGKSTLLSLLVGIETPREGVIAIRDEGENRIGYMLQKDHLFEWRTILENTLLGLEINHCVTKENVNYVKYLLKQYGLSDYEDYKPSQLSGGMRQRVALIRTLALKPDILLLDEPFSALDYQTRLHVADDVYNIIKREGKTAIMVTHDIAEAVSMADRIIVLSQRPIKIKDEIDIVLDVENRTPFKSRSDKNFSILFNKIWKELEDE